MQLLPEWPTIEQRADYPVAKSSAPGSSATALVACARTGAMALVLISSIPSIAGCKTESAKSATTGNIVSTSSERSLDEMLSYTGRTLGTPRRVNGGPDSPVPGRKCQDGSAKSPCVYVTEPIHFSILWNAYKPVLGSGINPSLDINPFKVMASFDLDRVMHQAVKILAADHKVVFKGRSAASVLVTTKPEPVSDDRSAHYQVFAQLTVGCDESEVTFMNCGFYASADRIVLSTRGGVRVFEHDETTVRLESMILDEIQIAMKKE